jgi:hypothetical protein
VNDGWIAGLSLNLRVSVVYRFCIGRSIVMPPHLTHASRLGLGFVCVPLDDLCTKWHGLGE